MTRLFTTSCNFIARNRFALRFHSEGRVNRRLPKDEISIPVFPGQSKIATFLSKREHDGDCIAVIKVT